MSRILITIIITFLTYIVQAQSIPITNGLVAHFDDASTNYSITNGTGKWVDNISNIEAFNTLATTTPQTIVYNGHTGLAFNNGQYLETNLLNDFSSNDPTIFVVRRGTYYPYEHMTVAALSKSVIDEEFLLCASAAYYHSSSGNFIKKIHQCNDEVPPNQFVISAANYVKNVYAVNHYLNGVKSTSTNQTFGYLFQITPGPRKLGIGHRIDFNNDLMFTGEIYEVIIYNRQLSDAEMNIINNYLVCKYDMSYTFCEVDLNCIHDQDDPNDEDEDEEDEDDSDGENNGDTTSIKSYKLKQNIDIYPNPTESILTINHKFNKRIDITLFDMIGRMYYRKDNVASKTVNINFEHLPKGIYNLKIGNYEDGYAIKKIIKN